MNKNDLTTQAFSLYFRLKSHCAEQSEYRQAFIQPIVDKAYKRYQRRQAAEYHEKRTNTTMPCLVWT